jgi:Acetyltransferase (GNAT) family
MLRCLYSDKSLVVDILTQSFADNKSVNYIIWKKGNKQQHIKKLMEYSFDLCYLFGDVFLSNDKKACALIIMPDKKKVSIKTIFLDLKLIFSATGLGNLKKAIQRESKIKSIHPPGLLYYLWFIGVEEKEQNRGIGSKLLAEVINHAIIENRIICLETSTNKNIPWYEKFGFTIYKELDFGYRLYCLKRDEPK